MTLRLIIAIVIMIVSGVSTWMVTRRAQGRMKNSLGRKATDLELASLSTWMRVDELEQRAREREPNHPR